MLGNSRVMMNAHDFWPNIAWTEEYRNAIRDVWVSKRRILDFFTRWIRLEVLHRFFIHVHWAAQKWRKLFIIAHRTFDICHQRRRKAMSVTSLWSAGCKDWNWLFLYSAFSEAAMNCKAKAGESEQIQVRINPSTVRVSAYFLPAKTHVRVMSAIALTLNPSETYSFSLVLVFSMNWLLYAHVFQPRVSHETGSVKLGKHRAHPLPQFSAISSF